MRKDKGQKKQRFYIAYGSNLNLEQMRWRCPGAKPVMTALLKDCRLMYRGSGSGFYLTVEEAEGREVPVAVFSVTVRDEYALDRYEGYPRFYRKEEMGFPENEAGVDKAFIYIMNEDRPYGIPSAMYVDICEEGYRDFGFDTRYLEEAYRESEAMKDAGHR